MDKISLETPKVVTKTITYTQFSIKDIIITLNTSAKFVVVLYGDETDVIQIEMTPEEHNLWLGDDQYLIDFIKGKLAT